MHQFKCLNWKSATTHLMVVGRTRFQCLFGIVIGTFVMLTLCGSVARAEVSEKWVKFYDAGATDSGKAVVVDSAGNAYVTGYSWSGSNSDFVTIKYDAAGTLLWVKRYNGPDNSNDVPEAIAIDSAGNVYVTGASYSATYLDFATIKYDPAGNQLWEARYHSPTGDNRPKALVVDTVGNVYVTGESFSGTNVDYATVKYSAAGLQQWAVRFNGSGNGHDRPVAVGVDAAGNVYVTGSVWQGFTNDYDYMTIKYSASGVQQWGLLRIRNY